MREREKKVVKWFVAIITIAMLVTLVCVIRFVAIRVKSNSEVRHTYKTAVKDYRTASKTYDISLMDQSLKEFQKLPDDYKDSKEYMSKISEEKVLMTDYEAGLDCYEQGDYENALMYFHAHEGYRESDDYVSDISGQLLDDGKSKLNQKMYDEARTVLNKIPEYGGTSYTEAQSVLSTIDELEKSDKLESKYQEAVELYNSGEYLSAQKYLL